MGPGNRGAIVSLVFLAGCAAQQQVHLGTGLSPVVADSVRLTATAAGTGVATAAPVASNPLESNPRDLVLADAEQLVGTPYRYGGSTPDRGFDCSGFVRWIYSRRGIDLPRTARAMSRTGVRVAARRAVLVPGDLLFFAEEGAAVSHVAVYAGEGRIVHASSGQGVVRYDDLDSARGQWFRQHVVLARRVIAAR
jgi:murein DD-endopeptidase